LWFISDCETAAGHRDWQTISEFFWVVTLRIQDDTASHWVGTTAVSLTAWLPSCRIQLAF